MKPVKKVSDLSGPALDWAVAKCEGVPTGTRHGGCYTWDDEGRVPYSPSSDWSLAGPIIERERIIFGFYDDHRANVNDAVHARYNRARQKPGGGTWDAHKSGPTPLIAAMRCYVASRLGDTVEIPEELV